MSSGTTRNRSGTDLKVPSANIVLISLNRCDSFYKNLFLKSALRYCHFRKKMERKYIHLATGFYPNKKFCIWGDLRDALSGRCAYQNRTKPSFSLVFHSKSKDMRSSSPHVVYYRKQRKTMGLSRFDRHVSQIAHHADRLRYKIFSSDKNQSRGECISFPFFFFESGSIVTLI